MFEYARTDIEHLAPEIGPLMLANWNERHRNLPAYRLSPNLDTYVKLEEQGWLYLFTARKDKQLVGYAIALQAARPHAMDELVASVDALYVMPEHRSQGAAAGLLRFMEDTLRADRVNTICLGTNDPRVARWLRMTGGYSYTETILEKGL